MKAKNIALCIILTILLIIVIFLVTDIIRLEIGKEPIFCICYSQYLDGGTKEYYGLGYKIIDYNVLEGFHGYKVGTYFMQYDNSLK